MKKFLVLTLSMLMLIMAFAGCVLISGFSGSFNAKGIMLGIFAGFGYALYSIFARIALNKYNTYTITFYTFVMSSVALLPFCQVGKVVVLLSDFGVFNWSVLLSVVSTVLPYILYTEGLKKISATKASIIAFIEPVTATITGAIMFNEPITVVIIVGMLLVLASIIKISSNN